MNKTLELIVNASDKASPVLLGGVGKAVSGLGSIAAGVATGGLALAGAAIAAVGAAAVGAGVMIFNFSQDTNKAMKKFGAQTGTAAEDLEMFKYAAQEVYAAGLGESIEDVVDSMSLVHQALGETEFELAESTRRAMILAEVFEVDVAESVNWVSSMTKSWKMSSEEAFDVITRGMQMGLDVAGDFGDVLHEYSGDFDRLGFSAEDMLGMLNAGLEEGAYNTDVIADGWREYGIRLMEGGEDMSEIFTSMGMDFERMQGFVAAGDETWGDYADTITAGLCNIENDVERQAAGVAIFGSKWEDVGGDIFLASIQAKEGVEGLGGATDAAGEQMATGIMPALERLKRKFLTEFAPLGDLAGEVIADKIVPLLETAAEWIGEKAPLAIAWLSEKFEEYWPIIQKKVADFWEKAQPILEDTTQWLGENVPEAIEWLVEKGEEFTDFWNNEMLPAFVAVRDFVEKYQTPILAGLAAMLVVVVVPAFIAWAAAAGSAAIATITALAPVLIPILAIGAAVGLLVAAWENDWGGIRTFLIDVWENSLKPALESLGKWVGNLIPGHLRVLRTALEWLKGVFDGFGGSLSWVSDMLSWMCDRIRDAQNAFNRLDLPDWLTPGSPTPLETGLLGIGDAFKKLDTAPQVNWMNQAATGGVGGTGAGSAAGAVTSIQVNFGRGSVRSDEDMQFIIDSMQQTLELQGVRSRIA